jgi:hypothetical protein
LAPLASADPTEITTTVDSEIASLNSLFTGEAALAGDTVTTNGANTFDTVPLADAPDSGTPTTLDYELYGVNPIAQAGSDPGAYDLFNGALGKFGGFTRSSQHSRFGRLRRPCRFRRTVFGLGIG